MPFLVAGGETRKMFKKSKIEPSVDYWYEV